MRITLLTLVLCALGYAQTTINGGRTVLGPVDNSGAVSTKPAKSGATLPATCSVGEEFFKTDATAGQNKYGCTATNTWTQQGVNANQYKGAALVRSFGFDFGDPGGSALTAGATQYGVMVVPFACTIASWDIAVDAGTASIKLWRVATGGTAIPTSANSINTSGVAIASGTYIHSTTLTDFTSTAIAANDVVAINLSAAATAKYVHFQANCNQ